MLFITFVEFLMIRIVLKSQASDEYDPSFVTEVLQREIYSDNPFFFQLMAQYLSGSRYHSLSNRNLFFVHGPLSRCAEVGSNTKSSMEDFRNMVISSLPIGAR